MSAKIASWVALDNIRHNGKRYEAGDELDVDDFTEQELELLLAVGVIVAGAVDVDKTDTGNETKSDASQQKPKNK